MSLEARIAWAAGLFEGEGTISLRGNRSRRTGRIEKNVSIYMALAMTDEDVVRKFHEVIFKIGSVTGPYTSKQKTVGSCGRKAVWRWSVTNTQNCVTVYELLRPWLGSRRRQDGDAALVARYIYEQSTDHFNVVQNDFPEWVTTAALLG